MTQQTFLPLYLFHRSSPASLRAAYNEFFLCQFSTVYYTLRFILLLHYSLKTASWTLYLNTSENLLGIRILLTVLRFLIVIMSLSGQKLLSYPIYPKVRVYPREVCTHNNGSLGPPWGLLGGSPKLPPFIVLKLGPPLPYPGGRFWGVLLGTLMYPKYPNLYPHKRFEVSQRAGRQREKCDFLGSTLPHHLPQTPRCKFFAFLSKAVLAPLLYIEKIKKMCI